MFCLEMPNLFFLAAWLVEFDNYEIIARFFPETRISWDFLFFNVFIWNFLKRLFRQIVPCHKTCLDSPLTFMVKFDMETGGCILEFSLYCLIKLNLASISENCFYLYRVCNKIFRVFTYSRNFQFVLCFFFHSYMKLGLIMHVFSRWSLNQQIPL